MPDSVLCFLLEETDKVQLYARRYRHNVTERDCPGPMMYHNRAVPFATDSVAANTYLPSREIKNYPGAPFPEFCECGAKFIDSDCWQIFQERIYRRADTGEEMTTRDAGPGAMWNGWWYGKYMQGDDGQSLIVKLPNGSLWMIDSRANNCTRTNDDQNLHRCWIRHGEAPLITVDKDTRGGTFETCAAGAGSIAAGGWHGFLTNGVLQLHR